MAQHDYNIANGSGSTVRADINAALDAVVSQNSGATAPSTTFAYMLWADTTAGIMKLRNAANTAWLNWFNLDGTVVDGSIATNDLANNAVSNAKFRQSAGLSIVGRSANSTGDVDDITAANDGEVMRRSGTTIGFGTVATAGIAANAITNAKAAQMAANTIKGRITASTGDPEDLTAANVKTILALVKADVGLGNVDNTSNATERAAAATLTNKTLDAATNTLTGFGVSIFAGAALVTSAEGLASSDNDTSIPTTAAVIDAIAGAVASGVADGDKGDLTVSGSGLVWTIDANAVTNAKSAQMANNTIKGRITAGTGDPEDLTAANVKTILALTKSDVGLSNVDNTSDSTKFDNIAGRIRGVNPQTGTTYTFVIGDAGDMVTFNNASAITATIPPNSSVAFPVNQTVINLAQLGAGQVSIAPGSGVTLNSSGTKRKLSGQYSTAAIVKYATDTWLLFGDIVT